MRISDWSSDVCSSDLKGGDVNSPPRSRHGRSRAEAKKGGGAASPALFPSQRRRSPPRRLALVLLVEPRLQRREIVRHRLARHFAGAGERLKRVGPGLRRAHFEHRVQLRADRLVAIEGTTVERPLPPRLLARRLIELELQDRSEEH